MRRPAFLPGHPWGTIGPVLGTAVPGCVDWPSCAQEQGRYEMWGLTLFLSLQLGAHSPVHARGHAGWRKGLWGAGDACTEAQPELLICQNLGLERMTQNWPDGLSGTPCGCSFVTSPMEPLWEGTQLLVSSSWAKLFTWSWKEVSLPSSWTYPEYEACEREL